MKIYKHYLTKNRCYKKYNKMTPKGIVVHSTGCNNKNVTRYVDMKELGEVSSNHWNKSNISKCVNGIIGYSSTKKKAVAVQTLPDNCKPWGCGSGSKGSYNNTHFQFEICEENGTDKTYFKQAWELAVQWCAKLCKEYNIPVSNVVSHKEAHDAGYGTNHGDADSYFKHFDKTMKDFRADVEELLKGTGKIETLNSSTPKSDKVESKTVSYIVKVTTDSLNVRESATTNSSSLTTIKKGSVYKVTKETVNDGYTWGYIENKKGYIALKYTKKLSTMTVNTGTDTLNCRESKSTSAKVLGKFTNRTKVYIISKTDTKIGKGYWYKVTNGIITGYVNSLYLK